MCIITYSTNEDTYVCMCIVRGGMNNVYNNITAAFPEASFLKLLFAPLESFAPSQCWL
jgi:hypothetical protein